MTMLIRPERIPDLLRERVGTYFERDGLCFAPILETTPGGACVMAVYFQNRRAGRAEARVRVRPPRRVLWVTRHELPAPNLSFGCPGGAFGVIRAAFPIPARYQCRRMTFAISADVTYPEGRGELLRFRAGLPVTRWAWTLPQGVAETILGLDAPVCEFIWMLESHAVARLHAA